MAVTPTTEHLVPSGWRTTTLGDLAHIQRGASPRPITDPKWFDPRSEIGWVRISDATRVQGRVLTETADHLSPAGVANSRFLPAGSLIMSICATIGIPTITGFDTCIHDGFVGFTELRNVDQNFLLFKLRELEATFRGLGQTGSQANLNSDLVRGCQIALPDSVREQRAIAEVLADFEDAASGLTGLLEKKRAAAAAVSRSLVLGERRLPGFDEPWEERPVTELADIVGGSTPSSQKRSYWNGPIPWCTPTDITSTSAMYIGSTSRTITEDGLRACAAALLPEGSVLLCTRATVGEARIAKVAMSTNQGFKSLIPRPWVNSEFLLHAMLHRRSQLKDLSSGSTFLELSKKDLGSVQVAVPVLEEQEAIAEVLIDLERDVEATVVQRRKLEDVRQTTARQLLTGTVRVS